MNPFFYVAALVSLAFSGVIATALVTYIVRTWQVIRSEREESLGWEALDRLDRIEARLDMLVERSEGGRALPPGDSTESQAGESIVQRPDAAE